MPGRQVVMLRHVFAVSGVTVYRDAVPDSARLIDEVEVYGGWGRATVATQDGSGVDESRTNQSVGLVKGSTLWRRFDEVFSAGLQDYLCRYGAALASTEPQGYQILKYGLTERYVAHMDDGVLTPRRVSALIYLNDDYEGGGLEFPHFGIHYQPVAGDLVMFPSAVPYQHAALPVTAGVKYSAVTWWY